MNTYEIKIIRENKEIYCATYNDHFKYFSDKQVHHIWLQQITVSVEEVGNTTTFTVEGGVPRKLKFLWNEVDFTRFWENVNP